MIKGLLRRTSWENVRFALGSMKEQKLRSFLTLLGVMGIPPLEADPDAAFARLAEEHRRVMRSHPRAAGLSAGMSDDLEIAVKHGSTCVRVGTALMGRRPLTSP